MVQAGVGDEEKALAEITALGNLIMAYAPHDGLFNFAIPGLHAVRASKITDNPSRVISQLGVCIIAGGSKRAMLGKDIFDYDRSNIVVYSAEVPVSTAITRASKDDPYLCLVIGIDAQHFAELTRKVYPHGLPKMQDLKAIYVAQRNQSIIKTAIRLMEMLAEPEDAALIAPLLLDEILLRLLRSPAGPVIAQIGVADSNAHKVSNAIAWLRNNYVEPVKIDQLAQIANMSTSSFHLHFKALTSMSPLQYQKTLRLQEARRLMLTNMVDVTNAGLSVGYLSTSQFSREYSRFFGRAPKQDIAHLQAAPAPRDVQSLG
ncbi:MAG: AraC family transcriptional regulator [Micavibrio sp.]|nr:AraC family transcriptional regulator [Micavibrio sp.]